MHDINIASPSICLSLCDNFKYRITITTSVVKILLPLDSSIILCTKFRWSHTQWGLKYLRV